MLARLALATGDTDALGYTGIRLVSGALMLAAILYGHGQRHFGSIEAGGL